MKCQRDKDSKRKGHNHSVRELIYMMTWMDEHTETWNEVIKNFPNYVMQQTKK